MARNIDGGLRARVREFERGIIREAMREHGGNQRQAAIALKVNRTTLAMRLKALGLRESNAA